MVDEPVLVRPAAAGDAQAALFEEHALALQRVAFLLTGSASAAEELVQDAFEQVVRRWDALDNPPGYLRVAVVNGTRSWRRREHRHVPEPPSELARLDEEAIAVREALATLRHDEREVVVLRYFLGLTDSQIAAELDRPIGTVKSQIFRGLARLKEVLS
jgi:RNA polymerase sigma factor (sigma-70 family)